MFFLESYDIDAVIHIVVPDEVVRQRVLARRLCSQCGLDYNLIYHRPNTAGKCDVCGGALITRPDDNQQAVDDRLREYHSKTEPVLEWFRRKERVLEVPGESTPEEIQADIRKQLGLPASSAGDS
jgi:adenylate kinase